MARAETTASKTRAPRGTKPVTQAFFTALDAVPEMTRPAVAKAAQTMIRDELKTRREKLKAAAAKEKASRPAAAKRAAAAEPAEAAAPAKRRSRKQAGASVAG